MSPVVTLSEWHIGVCPESQQLFYPTQAITEARQVQEGVPTRIDEYLTALNLH